MKPTYIMTSSEHVARLLSVRCDRSHEHQHVLGQVHTHEGSQARSKCAQERFQEMCTRVVHALLRERREGLNATMLRSVHMTESLGDDQSEKRVVQVLRRCHANLGHPSPARFISMLKNATATERCVKLAKGLSCPTCVASRIEKSRRVARHERAEQS